jgi:hypothetical protein
MEVAGSSEANRPLFLVPRHGLVLGSYLLQRPPLSDFATCPTADLKFDDALVRSLQRGWLSITGKACQTSAKLEYAVLVRGDPVQLVRGAMTPKCLPI